MTNTYRIMLLLTAALTFSGGARAQDFSANQAANQSAIEINAGAAVAPPLSITQRYVPGPRASAPLELLVDTQAPAALAQADARPMDNARGYAAGDVVTVTKVGPQPAINALGAGRLAITVSHTPRESR